MARTARSVAGRRELEAAEEIVRWGAMCKKMIEDYEKQMSGK